MSDGHSEEPVTVPRKRTTRERLRTILAIARAQYRSEDHKYTKSRRKKVLVYVGVAAMLPILGLLLWYAYGIGETVAAGELPGLVDLVRWYLPAMVVIVAVFGASEVHKLVLDFEAKPLLLTTVPDRDIVLGLLGQGLAIYVLMYAVSVALLLGAFAYGVGEPVVALVGGVAAVLLFTSSYFLGFVGGLLARLSVQRLSLFAGKESLYGTVGHVGIFTLCAAGGAYLASVGIDVSEGMALSELTPDGPPPLFLASYADLLFFGTPLVDGIGTAAIVSAVCFIAVVPLSIVAMTRLAPPLWRADPSDLAQDEPQPDSAGETDSTSYLDRSLPLLDRQTGVIVYGLYQRAARLPKRFAFVAYYFMFLGLVVAGAVGDLSLVATYLGGSLVVVGLWLAGGVFGLNPLGEEGTMVSQIVLSGTPAERFINARVLAGVAVGTPFVVAGTAVLSIDVLTASETLALGAYWLSLLPVSGAIAVGVGTFLPNTETRKILDAIETRAPDMMALACHGLVVLVLAVAGSLLVVGLVPLRTLVLGTATLGIVVAVLAHGGYRFAVARIAAHGQPRPPDRIFALELGVGLALLGMVLSVTVPEGVLLIVPVGETLGFLVGFIATFVGWGIVVVAYLLATGRRNYLDVRLPSRSDLQITALGTAGALSVYTLFVAGQVYLGLPAVEHSLVEGVVETDPRLLLALVVLVVAANAPIEELLFRNVIQKRFTEALSSRVAIGAAALVFALVHLPVYTTGRLPAIAVTIGMLTLLGGIFGVVYDRTENVVVPSLCHGIYNAALFVALYVTVA